MATDHLQTRLTFIFQYNFPDYTVSLQEGTIWTANETEQYVCICVCLQAAFALLCAGRSGTEGMAPP